MKINITFTQKAVAQKAGISEGFLSDILNGNRRPQWRTAKRLAEVTGTDPVLWVDAPPDVIRAALIKAE